MAELEDRVAADVLNTFSRHICAPCVHFRAVDAQGELSDRIEQRAYSGCVVELYGDWFFLTAGHCIRNLKSAIDATGIVLETAVLVDSFTIEASRDLPILLDLDNPAWLNVVDKEAGLDFALLRLEEPVVALMKEQRIEPLPPAAWADFDRHVFDHYYIVGLPSERQTFNPEEESGSLALTLLRVDPADAPADVKTVCPGVYGQIDMDSFSLKTIEGMSGGPVFGVMLGAQPEYRLAAVQSMWWEDSGLVFGCRVDVIRGLLEAWIADSLARETGSA